MTLILDFLVLVLIITIVMFIVTQVIVPVVTGKPVFPLFRKSAVKAQISEAEKTLNELAEKAELMGIVNEVERRTAELEKK